MFPIADVRGRVLGFGARAMRDEQGGKYVNTPEGGLFHKGRLLFGIDLAAKPAAKARRMIVAEGYTDVMALPQAGFEETVALMGTAATEQPDRRARAPRGRRRHRLSGARRRQLGPGGHAAGHQDRRGQGPSRCG